MAVARSPLRGSGNTLPRQLKSPLPAVVATPPMTMDKTLASVANLAKLLPTGMALAFQSLFPSFTIRGACLPSNHYLTAALPYLCIQWVDYVHAVFPAVVFLTVAFSNAAMQSCFFPNPGDNVDQMLTNLPLGAGFFSTMVFLVFPTTRKGIDYTGPFTTVL